MPLRLQVGSEGVGRFKSRLTGGRILFSSLAQLSKRLEILYPKSNLFHSCKEYGNWRILCTTKSYRRKFLMSCLFGGFGKSHLYSLRSHVSRSDSFPHSAFTFSSLFRYLYQAYTYSNEAFFALSCQI